MAVEIKFNYGTALPSNPNAKQLYFIKNGDKGKLYKGSELIAETSFEENLALQDQISKNANSLAALVGIIEKDYLTKESAEETYLTQDAASGYLTKDDASRDYLTKDAAGQAYVTKTTIENDYLTKDAIANSYLTKDEAGQTYVTDTVVKNDYLNKTDAETIYLTKYDASGTYLTQDAAGKTYATQTSLNSAINTAKTEAINSAVDRAVEQIVGEGAAESLDTIAEISKALNDNPDIIDALNGAIGTKADQSALNDHIANKSTNSLHLNSDEKTKLDGIQAGAQVNQNAFKNITVGSSTIVADTQEDTLTIAAGNHINISADATNDKLTFSVPNASTTVTGAVLLSDAVNSTSTELGATANAVKKAYDLANGKQNKIVGAATTITDSNLTINRALVSDANGKVAVSGITSTKLGYLTDVTDNIQTQLNGKIGKGEASASDITSGVLPVARGGTGQTTLASAANALVTSMPTGDTVPVDSTNMIIQGVGNYTGTYYLKPISLLWEYIKGKISSVLGLTASNYNGTAAKATSTKFTQDTTDVARYVPFQDGNNSTTIFQSNYDADFKYNPVTNELFAQNLKATTATFSDSATIQYNSDTESIDFTFA